MLLGQHSGPYGGVIWVLHSNSSDSVWSSPETYASKKMLSGFSTHSFYSAAKEILFLLYVHDDTFLFGLNV